MVPPELEPMSPDNVDEAKVIETPTATSSSSASGPPALYLARVDLHPWCSKAASMAARS